MSPALADAVNLGRVQGIDSSLADLTLYDGRQLSVEIGGAIVKTPTLSRTISGGSSIKLEIHDHDLDFLDVSLLAEKFDAELDGLHFRLIGQDLGESGIALTLKDRDIAILEEFDDPVSALREDTTRAEFILSLIRIARPNARVCIPELSVVQPIETKRQAKKAKDESKANRGKGIGETKGLVFKGQTPTAGQRELAETALQICESVKAPFICRVAVIAALIDETDMGLVQRGNVLAALEPYTQVRDAAEEISGFLTGNPTWTGTTAIEYYHAHPDAPAHVIAQAVQKSATADGSNYAAFVGEAEDWVNAYEGGEFAGATGGGGTRTIAYKFEFDKEKDKNWWGLIKRLAKEVNWRAFWVAGRFFFIDEIDLFRGMVRLAIDRDTPGVQKVTGSWRHARPTTDITVTAFATDWKVPPGGVVTLAEYGAFSVGLGDAPVKGGFGIGPAHSTEPLIHRARYLVDTIESPLRDSDTSQLRKVTIKLRKPTAPLPEPAAETKKVSTKSGGTGFVGGSGEMGTYSGTAEDVVNEVIDYAHSHGFPAVTRETVRAANATHGPTVSGGRSDHQGPPATAWAADISNGYETPEEAALAKAIADAFGIPWDGAGLVTHEANGYRLQLIHNTMEGGNHYNHVHFGCEVM